MNIEEVSSEIIKSRIRKLKSWHEKLLNCDNEYAYLSWINIVPDEPCQDDFEVIAESDENFHEVEALYHRLIDRYGDS